VTVAAVDVNRFVRRWQTGSHLPPGFGGEIAWYRVNMCLSVEGESGRGRLDMPVCVYYFVVPCCVHLPREDVIAIDEQRACRSACLTMSVASSDGFAVRPENRTDGSARGGVHPLWSSVVACSLVPNPAPLLRRSSHQPVSASCRMRSRNGRGDICPGSEMGTRPRRKRSARGVRGPRRPSEPRPPTVRSGLPEGVSCRVDRRLVTCRRTSGSLQGSARFHLPLT
jgi:hypothetical protein